MTTIQQIVFDSLVIGSFSLGLFAALVGAGLVVYHKKMFRLFAVLNRYVSTRRGFKAASVPREVDPAVLKHRMWFAVVIIVGAVYSLFSLIVNFNAPAIAAVVATAEGGTSYVFALWITEALGWAMRVFSVVALAVGIMLAFFPDTLRAVQTRANRWYSVRKATAGMDDLHMTVDRWVEAFPRTAGLGITAGALIVVFSSAIMLFK